MNIIATVLLFASVNVLAASDGKFSCESINEKSVRLSCIKDRVSSSKLDAEELERSKIESAEKSRVNDIIVKLQKLLTKDFKDPMSAQFTELVFVERPTPTLCGKVNGKNSYGGYVGERYFYVVNYGSSDTTKIVDEPKAGPDSFIYESEMRVRQIFCKNGVNVK